MQSCCGHESLAPSGVTMPLLYVNAVNRCLCTYIAALPVLCVGNASLHDMQASMERLGYDATAMARNVSRTASGGHAALAREFFASSLCGSPRARRATMKSGDRDLKRATRACGFGLERLPWPGDGLFASACLDCYLARSARDSRAAAQIKLCLSRSHYQHAAGAEKL